MKALEGCYMGVTRASEGAMKARYGCYEDVRMRYESSKGAMKALYECYKGGQGRYKGAIKTLRRRYEGT